MSDKLNITQTDFQGIKDSLKDYLKAQPEFTDFDFEGSGLSILLDVLAYNTHYMAFYANVAANEAFLDSAQLRESVVSKAKEIGYVPRSRRSPVATVSVTATPAAGSVAYDALASVTMEPGTIFSTNINGKAYEFVNIDTVTLFKSGSSFVATDVELREGTWLSYRWVVDTTNPVRYTIPNPNVDVSTLKVTVQKSALDTTTEVFKPAESFSDLKSANAAYWVYEVEKGYYELQFGDGILGKKLNDGNIIRVEYLTTDGEAANKAFEFDAVGSIQGLSNIAVTTTTAAYGGADRESIDSIKFNSIRQFSSQNRAVTEEDYEAILKREFPFIESVSVWGGEKNDPPQFGKVFISIKPKEGLTITAQVKEDIKDDILSRYNIVAVLPEIVDPDFIFLNLDVEAKYNPILTTRSTSDLQNDLISTVSSYEATELGKFEKDFIHSDLVGDLRAVNTAITSILIEVTVEKRPRVNIGVVGNYQFTFSNAIDPETVYVDGYKLTEEVPVAGATYFAKDDGEGNMNSYRKNLDGSETLLASAGTVNYTTGLVTLQQLNIESTDNVIDQTIVAKAVPQKLDVNTSTNKIIVIEPDDVTVTVTTD